MMGISTGKKKKKKQAKLESHGAYLHLLMVSDATNDSGVSKGDARQLMGGCQFVICRV